MYDIKKLIKKGAIILFILLIIIIVPLPVNEPLKDLNLYYNEWSCNVAKKDAGGYAYCKMTVDDYPNPGMITVRMSPEAEIYIEKDVSIPNRAAIFEFISYNNNRIGHINFPSLYFTDEEGIRHTLEMSDNVKLGMSDNYRVVYNISQFAGQQGVMRLDPASIMGEDTTIGHTYHGYYSQFVIHNKQYTFDDSLALFYAMLTNILIFSLLIGLIAGFSGLRILDQSTEKLYTWITENYGSASVLKPVFYTTGKCLEYANNIHNSRLRIGTNVAIVAYILMMTVYITKILIVVSIFIVAMIIGIIIALYIAFSILAGGPLGSGGGGGYGSGGSHSSPKSYSSSSAFEKTRTEETVKEDSRPFKDRYKETRSSETALPFGFGSDMIYKTEFEDKSTGKTVRGYGWTRDKADANARKNLKKE